MSTPSRRQSGSTYVELMLAVSIAALLLLGLDGVVGRALQSHDQVHERNDLTRQARFAMQRMVRAVAHTRLLLLPTPDRAATPWSENLREETVPPSAPPPGSSKASAVLALSLPRYVDLDGDGTPDADNDGDGRIDEDWPNDIHLDYASGIIGIDDDGDGSVDEADTYNDDEYSNVANEDPVNGVDDDGDGNVDEDPSYDMNGDGCPGVCGVDDDGDGQIDEGPIDDDDEDGQQYDDWVDPVVFYLNGATLQERTPAPWDENTDGVVDGRDYLTSDVAAHVSRFRVERIPRAGARYERVDLILELTGPVSGETLSLHTQVRVGGAL